MTSRHLPYSQISPTVEALLTSDDLARNIIEGWLAAQTGVTFKNKHNSFSNHYGQYVVTMGNVIRWSGERNANTYKKFYRYSDVFKSYGAYCIDEADSGRIEAAEACGLHNYVQMTRKLYLFSPRCVAIFLISAQTSNGDSFRQYIKDWAPEQRYCLPKLFATLNTTKETQNV